MTDGNKDDEELKQKLSELVIHIDQKQKEHLIYILESDNLISFLVWIESLKTVGSGITWFAWFIKKSITVFVWIVVPFVLLRLLYAGDLTLGEMLKWLAR
jgi:hypothetical protein